MKASLLRPLTRFKVMTSKSLAVFVLGCMVTLAMFVISLIVQIVSGNSLRSVPITFAAYLINMIPLIAIVSMALLINMISKSPTLAMLLCIVVYVFFKYLNYYITPVGQMVFTAIHNGTKFGLAMCFRLRHLYRRLEFCSAQS